MYWRINNWIVNGYISKYLGTECKLDSEYWCYGFKTVLCVKLKKKTFINSTFTGAIMISISSVSTYLLFYIYKYITNVEL